jgi:hypothetical protein
MNNNRAIYAVKTLSQVPRLLSQLDRNPYSSTYGSFDRSYWHDKATDFSNADAQLGAHTLALLYQFDFPENPYKGQPWIKEWAIAALTFWAGLQHADGTFDEHYPFERGWAGPTAFLVYYNGEAYRMLKDAMSKEASERVAQTIRRAAYAIIRGEAEEDRLANHHALACLAVWKAHELFGESALKKGYERLWNGFLELHNRDEGWSLEYDGADPGYLSATVSFLAKMHDHEPVPGLKEVLRQAIDFCSYFVFPDGSYAGNIGSRHTHHFYPHGFEIMAKVNGTAQAIAARLSKSLEEGNLVPPEIMSDRYMVLRMSEYLLACLAASPRPATPTLLPCEQEPFVRYFPSARVQITNRKNYYLITNLGKGGVLRVCTRPPEYKHAMDSGIMARLADGAIVTSQWINPNYEVEQSESGWVVRGSLQKTPLQKPFTVFTHVIFRLTLLVLGWCAPIAHWLKGQIRKTLMLSSSAVPIRFTRTCSMSNGDLVLVDEIRLEGRIEVRELSIGADVLMRHVPQSQYFMRYELAAQPRAVSAKDLDLLNREKRLVMEHRLNIDAP